MLINMGLAPKSQLVMPFISIPASSICGFGIQRFLTRTRYHWKDCTYEVVEELSTCIPM